MHEALITYIHTQLTRVLSDDEKAAIEKAFKPKKLRKHQYLLQEGEVCKLAGFIVKGAMKQYSVDETGKESILVLAIENWWVGDRESFSQGMPSAYFIDAFEETTLLVITKEDYEKHLSQQPFMADLLRILVFGAIVVENKLFHKKT